MKLYIVSYTVSELLDHELFLSDPEVFTSKEEAVKAVEQNVNDEIMEYSDGEYYRVDDDENNSKDDILDRTIEISSSNRVFILKVKTK